MKLPVRLWGLLLMLSMVFMAARAWHGQILDTSLLTLLPAAEHDPLLQEANRLLSRRASRLLAILVGNRDAAQAVRMGERLTAELEGSGLVRQSLTDISASQQKAFYDLYYPFRYQMLSPGDRRRMEEGSTHGFTHRLAGALYSPASSFLKNLIPQDPLLLFPELAHSWMETAAPPSPRDLPEGIVFADPEGFSYALVAVELAPDPFDVRDQDRMNAFFGGVRQHFAKDWPGSRFYMSGVLPFATAERIRTEREMTWVSVGSLIGVLLLTWNLFASPRALVLAGIPILAGFTIAAAATLAVFGSIHIITLAFGSSLIGVAIDYPLLYLTHDRMDGSRRSPRETLRRILPGILLGALTTLMGYAALSLAPFPGLRQMALFSSVGLAAALVTVILVLPEHLPASPLRVTEPVYFLLGKKYVSLLNSVRVGDRRQPVLVALSVAALLIMGGLFKLTFNDDIRRLQHPSEAVAREDAFVRMATQGVGGSRFVLVRGGSQEALLKTQEALQDRLRALTRRGLLSSAQSLAPFLPSQDRQERDRALVEQFLQSHAPALQREWTALGLPNSTGKELLTRIRRPLRFLSVDNWLASPASDVLRSLWVGPTAYGWASAVLVGGSEESASLRLGLADLPGVKFVDPVEDTSTLFKRYRRLSVGLVLAAYLGVWGLMLFRYGMKIGTLVTIPSVGALLITFGIFGWCGVPLHLIHCLASLLVLSMGIDYAIYFAECARAEIPPGPTLLAVEMCAFSTLWSFGLLALCRTPVLSAIGLTVFSGMLLAFLLSPLPYLAMSHTKAGGGIP